MSVTDKRRDGQKLRYEQFLSERQASATAIAVSLGPNSRKQRDYDQDRTQAEQEFLATQGELGNRPPNLDSKLENPTVFWAFAGIICVAEAMFNRVVVEMASPLPGPFAFGVAALISAALMFCAHLLGKWSRQAWSEINRSVYLLSVIGVPILLVLDAAGVLGIVLFRVYFATVDITSNVDIFETVTNVASMGLDLLAKVPSDPDALLLGGVNLFFLFIAAFVGAMSHDSERQYDTHYRTLKEKTATARAAVDKYERRQEALFRRYQRPLSRAVRGYVGNGGSIGDLPKDDFKAQRFEAESLVLLLPPPSSGQSLRCHPREMPHDPGSARGPVPAGGPGSAGCAGRI